MELVHILIRWLRQNPADLDLHCFLKRIYPGGSSAQGLNVHEQLSKTL